MPSAYEIIVGGRKVLGSAQSRRAGLVLQHGSLPLWGDLTRLVDCLPLTDERERHELGLSLRDHAATLEQVAGRRIGFSEARDALAAGFASALGLQLALADLTDIELQWAGEFEIERYRSPEWTTRR